LIYVSSVSNSVDAFKDVEVSGTIIITNNETVPIYNVSFTNVSNFRFPVIDVMGPGEVRNVSFTVRMNETFDSRAFVSVLSYLTLPAFKLRAVTTTSYDLFVSLVLDTTGVILKYT